MSHKAASNSPHPPLHPISDAKLADLAERAATRLNAHLQMGFGAELVKQFPALHARIKLQDERILILTQTIRDRDDVIKIVKDIATAWAEASPGELGIEIRRMLGRNLIARIDVVEQIINRRNSRGN